MLLRPTARPVKTKGPMKSLGYYLGQAASNKVVTIALVFCAFVCTVYILSPERRALTALKDVPPLRYRNTARGEPKSLDYSLYLTPEDGNEVLSFWHDIALPIQLLDGARHIVPMVYEIPKGTKAKMEINKEHPWNPIKQDVKNGALRYYPTASVVHYGAIPRTYEHPREKDDLTGLLGDGDPLDIVDVSDLPTSPGEVHWVKILGALAMEDERTADWKIVAMRLTDPRARFINDLSEVMDVRHVAITGRSSGSQSSHQGEKGEEGSAAKAETSATEAASRGEHARAAASGNDAAPAAKEGNTDNKAAGDKEEAAVTVSTVKKGTHAAPGAVAVAGGAAGGAAVANPEDAALAAAADAAAGSADANGKEIASTAAQKAIAKKAQQQQPRAVDKAAAASAGGSLSASDEKERKNLRKVVTSLDSLKAFLRDYKKKSPSDPDPVSFAYGGSYLDASTAVDVVRHHHIHWCRIIDEAVAGKRVASLSIRAGQYKEACDAARQKWSVELAEDEALGALAGGAGTAASEADSAIKALWLPVERSAENTVPEK